MQQLQLKELNINETDQLDLLSPTRTLSAPATPNTPTQQAFVLDSPDTPGTPDTPKAFDIAEDPVVFPTNPPPSQDSPDILCKW